jgi:hypothetical protein
MRYALLGLSAVLALLLAAPLAAQQPPANGDLVIAFEYDGVPPQPTRVPAAAVPAGCVPPLFDNSLVVGKNGGIRDVLVQLFIPLGGKPPAAPKPAGPAPEMTNRNCEFVPRMLLVRAEQKFMLTNNDPIGHNMNVASIFKPINNLLPPNAKLAVALDKPERMPIRVTCNLHNFMGGWIVVTDHPFVGASDETGKVVIKNLVPGDYTFQVWTERGFVPSPKEKATGKVLNWDRGKFNVKIAAGQNDQGVFLIK